MGGATEVGGATGCSADSCGGRSFRESWDNADRQKSMT